jgi:fucose permease
MHRGDTVVNMDHRDTANACYLCYVSQAAVNNLPPLLFATFQRQFHVDIFHVGLLVMLNFGTQLLANLATGRISQKIGYRRSIVLSAWCSTLGLVLLGLLPRWFGFSGVMAALLIGAFGCGVGDVLGSAIIQALPRTSGNGNPMALLHSAYCWGMVLVIGISSLLFHLLGLDAWPVVAWFWALFPLCDAFLFLRVPMVSMEDGRTDGTSLRSLFSHPVFWVLGGMMFCAAGSEISMNQWASLFAEQGLGVDKAVGDLLGPCLFALCMAVVRTWYGVSGARIPLRRVLGFSALVAVLLYGVAVFSPNRFVALLGCAFTGFAVALLWPGTLSLSATVLPHGGTMLFGTLAFFGNIGSTLGPQVVSLASSASGDLKRGLLLAGLFPLGMAILTAFSGSDGS